MNCPNCQASDVTRAAVEWEKGTRVSVRGAGKPNVRRVGDLHQNLSAFRLSPPDKPKARIWLTILLIFVCIVVAAGIGQGKAVALVPLLTLAAIVGPIVWCVMDSKKRSKGHVQAVAAWNRLWFCNRCGHVAEDAEFRTATNEPAGPRIAGGAAAGLISDQT
jgi:hypothetical protein